MITNILFMTIVELVTLLIFVLLFNLDVFSRLSLLLTVMVLGTVGFVAVGTLFSAMATNTRYQEVMLPILLFPIVIPVVIGAVKSTAKILTGAPWEEFSAWLKLLAGFDLIFIVLCYLTFEYVIAE